MLEEQIQMVDLHGQYLRFKEEIDEAMQAVIDSCAFINGPQVKSFAGHLADYLQVPYVIPCANGTDALQIALMALELQPGDEVILPAFTYIAAAEVVALLGLTPVLVDVDPCTFNIDPRKIEAAVSERTKAVVAVHLFGQACDMEPIMTLADVYHLYVVEDCAQGHDALYEGKMVGTLGDLGCFSFYPGKNLYAFGEGGSVTGYRKEYFDTIEMMKNQGCTVRYYHDMIGYNYRLEGIQGAVLSVSLKYLPEWTARRREIGWRYTKEITNPAITLQHHPENTNPVFHMFEVEVEDDPERFLAYMAEKGIECNRHYPVPCHLQNAYKHLGYQVGDCPNAEYLASHCATLPLFPEMTDEEVEMVIRACNAYQTT